MIHSHFPVRHLIRQVELYRERGSRSKTPGWLGEFVTHVADAFEPFSGIARVGFEAKFSEDGVWEIAIFLGDVERVGGEQDGLVSPVNFRFRIDVLQGCFSSIDRLEWNVFPAQTDFFEDSTDLSFLLVQGLVQDKPVRVQIQSVAPDAAGPGIRCLENGEYEAS